MNVKPLLRQIVPAPLRRAYHAAMQAPDTSQHGEVPILQNLSREYNCPRFLVDVGAHDGVSLSNSWPFIQSGWNAILIEASPTVFQKLQANHRSRASVKCIQMACMDRPGEAELYVGSDGASGFLATLCTDQNEWFQAARSPVSLKVKTDTLTNILIAQSAPPSLGMLLVDAEGMDYEVLAGLDFSRFRPAIVVTEEYELDEEKHARKYSLLIRNHYSLLQKIGCNTIWLDRN